jgi:hypothetical protein
VAHLVDLPETYLKRHLRRRSRVLLVNPPVQERRYHWLRWNQPTELLRLSAWLKSVHPSVDIRLFDFMFPDGNGAVPKHKVKETWTGSEQDAQLWHFGHPFDTFESELGRLTSSGWVPDLIVVSSLTSYWHLSIEKLLIKVCAQLGERRRRKVKLCLYGNYPRIEPEHAAAQPDADVAFARTVDARGLTPDFSLYVSSHRRLPAFFGLDIEDPAVVRHLEAGLRLLTDAQRNRGLARPPCMTVAFFNEDICSPGSQLAAVAEFVSKHPRQVVVEGIAGIEPRSLTVERLAQLKSAGFRSLFVEHARRPGGGLDTAAYQPLLTFLSDEDHAKRSGRAPGAWLDKGGVTGFVTMGLPDDDLDELIGATLQINSFFHAVILKPHGYSPTLDHASSEERRARWATPSATSPQRYPYVGNGSPLTHSDYANLVRWQNLLNKRVKGTTFDFLGDGNVARMVRETLVGESWKRRQEAP